MGWLKKIVLGLVALSALFVGIGFVLPAKQTAARSIKVSTSPSVTFAYLNTFKHFNSWSPWAALDPNTQYKIEGPSVGVGAKQSWASKDPNVGSGSQEIIASEPYQRITTRLKFEGWDTPSTAHFMLKPDGTGTHITWEMQAEMGSNPINRWFGVMLDSMVGKDYETGLAKLKVRLEDLKTQPFDGVKVDVVQAAAQPWIFVKGEGTLAEANAQLKTAFTTIDGYLKAQKITPAAAPIAVTTQYDEAAQRWAFEAGYPVPSGTAVPVATTGLMLGTTHGGLALRAEHLGKYDDLPKTYAALMSYKALLGLEDAGAPWEQYLTDPETTAPEKLVTHVFLPVK